MKDDKKTPLGELNAGDELQRQLRDNLPIDLKLRALGLIDVDGAPVRKSTGLESGIAHPEACTCRTCNACRDGFGHMLKTCTREGSRCSLRTKPKE